MKGLLIALGQTAGKNAGPDSMAAGVIGWISGQLVDPRSIPKALAVLALMTALDWITGIRASHIVEKAPIESAKLSRTADKMGARAIYILVFWLLAHQIPGMTAYGASVVLSLAFYFTVTEAWSICENLDRIGVPLPVWIRRRLKKVVDDLDEKGDDLAKGFRPLG